jgi:uncharacterized protein (TIGR03437 family)
MQKTLSTAYKFPLLVALALLAAVSAHAQISAVVNAASFVQNRSLTPGAIVSIFGKNLTNATAAANDPANLPLTLGGTTVDVNGVPCILFYVSPGQINAQISPKTPLGPAVLKVVSPTHPHIGSFMANVTIEAAGSPGIFSETASGTRDGAILNAVTFARGPFTVTTLGKPTYLAIYVTGLDLSAPPAVAIGGVPVRVDYAGKAPGFVGLQQINVELPASLAGAGRVEVAVTSGGKTSNIVEVVILPNVGEGTIGPDAENQQRHRELASIAWVPGTHFALLTDENDDVVRVIDVQQRAVIQTLTLPEGAEPVAVAVSASGAYAVVAERNRAKAAIIGLNGWVRTVLTEVDVDSGPGGVAIAGDIAAVASQDSDSVSLISLSAMKRVAVVPVGRGPRGIAVDAALNRAYVTNQGDGSITVIDLAAGAAIDTIQLGPDARPASILVVPGRNIAIVTEPSKGNDGQLAVVDLLLKTVPATAPANPDKSGGSTDIALYGSAALYVANQTGGSVTLAQLALGSAGSGFLGDTKIIKADLGARALAVDVTDKLLLVSNQGSGTVVLIDLFTNLVAGRIDGVRGEKENGLKHDDQADRDQATTLPTLTSVTPNQAAAGTSFTITVAGTNFKGMEGLAFIDPATLPANGKGGECGNHDHGPYGVSDPKITVTGIAIDQFGTKATASVTIAADAAKGVRIVRVLTPNGESDYEKSAVNTFTVQ